MSVMIDHFLQVIKWPVAVLAVLLLPAFVQAFDYFHLVNIKFLVFMAGIFLFLVFIRTMADKELRVSTEILAHEFVHAIFALLTFHRVSKVNVKDDNSGGSMTFKGEGNWLIVIAPYFFPLLPMFYMIVASLYAAYFPLNKTLVITMHLLLGFFTGYHLDMVVSQIHEKQTDLPKVTYKFCVMFLPAANLWAVEMIMAFNSKGWEGVKLFHQLIYKLCQRNLAYVINLLF